MEITDDWDRLLQVVAGRRMVALAGAGCSTESGIPDYRGNGTPRRRAPIQYQEFVRDSSVRARYWARSVVGWPRIRAARPNSGHYALSRMEYEGHLAGVITQNVDGLHNAAGSRRVVELHGSLSWVRCMECAATVARDAFQERLLDRNEAWQTWAQDGAIPAAPDGDAELPTELLSSFVVPDCAQCAGVMKPHVIFFGENVPGEVVRTAWRLFEEAEVLLVTGSSLAVYSGRRFVDRAGREEIPVVVLNRGPTRADAVAAAKVDGPLGVFLPALADALSAAGVRRCSA